jgi:nucleotide-binding universal stress UspA family protein
MFGKTIVAVDESSGGRDAIALAKQLVAPDAELTLAHVVSTSTWEPLASRAAYAAGERTKPGEQDRAEELLRTACDQAGVASHWSVSLRVLWSPRVGRVGEADQNHQAFRHQRHHAGG